VTTLFFCSMLALTSFVGGPAQPATGGLRIVVIEGEGAVNIIQQKTAVAPIVEVRDQNNLPVVGATVTFTIQGGKTAVFAGGSQTLTVTTNAAGRAVAAAVNPLNSGTVQIQAAAAFQGQAAAATITQTNVMTAAQAGASTGGPAGGGGGGLGVGAIAGIAGGVAAAGAAVVLTQKSDEAGGTNGVGGAGGGVTTAIDPAVSAALGTYTLVTVNGVGLPATTVSSPPATCAVVTDNATLSLTADNGERRYEVRETSRTTCPIGSNTNFQSGSTGTWTISGNTITFTPTSDNFLLDAATLSNGSLTMTVRPPHIDAGREAPRVTTVWRK
jgi:hypothetical protein